MIEKGMRSGLEKQVTVDRTVEEERAMRKSFSLLAVIAALGTGLMTGNANAFSPAPPPEPKSDVIPVLGGCGPGYYPDAYGQCVPRPYYGGGGYYGGGYYGGAYRGGVYRGGVYRGGVYRGGVYRGGVYRGGAYRGGAYRGGAYRGGAYRGGYRGGAVRGGGYRGGVHRGGYRGGGRGGRRSDFRLKHDITLLGYMPNGLGFYRFVYNGGSKAYVGVIAQEVRGVMPEAVFRGRDGYLRVDYDKIGVKFQTFDQWSTSGAQIPAAVAPEAQ
jgi:hypothetical protein